MFECSTRYLTSERSERVRCRVEHKKIKFMSTSGHVIFCLLHKHTNDDVFDGVPKISDHFPKIFRRFSKIVPKVRRTFPNVFSKIFRRFPKISEEAPMRFRSYSNTSKHFLRDCGTITMVIILVTMATPIYFISSEIYPHSDSDENIGTQSVQELFFVIAFVELFTVMI